CLHCKQPFQPDALEQRLLGISEAAQNVTIFRATGCEHCDYQGYRARMAIMELLNQDADLDELIARRATTRELKSMALSKGFHSLAEDGIRRVLDGSTSLDEISRVVDLTDRLTS
ncbi:MAG: secretion system protein E, partial [Deltaproteobacteria bacterium]|nr:secretion system protein E [Deltaproteobacteria bacterium]